MPNGYIKLRLLHTQEVGDLRDERNIASANKGNEEGREPSFFLPFGCPHQERCSPPLMAVLLLVATRDLEHSGEVIERRDT